MGKNSVNTWFQEAFQHHTKGDLAGAKSLYQQILSSSPKHAQSLFLLGTLESQCEQFSAAEGYLRRALALRPDWPEALNNLGLTISNLGRYGEAEPLLRRALALSPEYPDAIQNLAGVLDEKGEIEDAINLYQQLITLHPNRANAHYGLGLSLKRLQRLEEAARSFERTIELSPKHFDACNNLGAMLKILNRLEEAERWLRRAVEINPNFHGATNNLAATLQAQDRLLEALEQYDRALTLDAEKSLVQWNRAFILLALGRLKEGWVAYEWRRPVYGWQPLPFAEWDGTSLTDKTILIFAEQGLGDEIMFASCASDLIERAAHCLIECEPRLASLYQRSFPKATVIGVKRADRDWIQKLPTVDLQIPAGSIAQFLRTDLSDFPTRPGYLVADPGQVEHWRVRLRSLGLGPKIGITWRSGLTREGRHRNYSRLSEWGEILRIPGLTFVNLQYDECKEELAIAYRLFGVKIHAFPELDLFNDLDGAAALTSALDLVVAAGNAVCEISGALGVSVWRLEAHGRPWTSLGTPNFPWHPKMRIFRQKTPGDWTEVLARVKESLSVGLDLPNTPAFYAEEEKKAILADSSNLKLLELEYRQALAESPNSPEIHNNLANVLFDAGDFTEAENHYRIALSLYSDFPEAHYNLANVLHERGEREASVVEQRAAIALRPHYAEAHCNLGRTLQELGNLEEAEIALRQALVLAPNLSEVHHNLGVLLRSKDRLEDSILHYQQALALQPFLPKTESDLANVLRELGRVEEAETHARRAVQQSPVEDSKIWIVLGDVLQDLNQFSESLAAYDRALGFSPALAIQSEIRRNRSICLLAMGNLTNGWEAYTARHAFLPTSPFQCPEWNGEFQKLIGKILVVLSEQGLGDQILFASCLSDLAKVAENTIVLCDSRLVSLYKRSFPLFTVLSVSSFSSVSADFQIRIGDLPRIFRTSLDRFPTATGYLIPDPNAHWKDRLASLGKGFKVGIVWRSGLLQAARQRYYAFLKDWEQVLKTPGVLFVNLQYQDTSIQEILEVEKKFGIKIHHFPEIDLKNDLESAAALSSEMDLVIGVGTAATELAAAVGTTVWRLEGHGRAWTSLGTSAMPWHPTVRLFKQPRWGDWKSVFISVAEALSSFSLECQQERETTGFYVRKAALSLKEEGETADAHIRKAENLFDLGRLEESESEYRKALVLHPHWARAHNDLGNLLRKMGRLAESERCYLVALRYQPDLVEAHNNLGAVSEQQGRIFEAETAYRAALRLKPHFPEGWYNLANCLGDLGHWQEAIDAYQEAISLRPEYPEAWMFLGTTFKNVGFIDKAEHAYRRALTFRPEWPDNLNLLANLLAQNNRGDEAEGYYQSALHFTPDSPEILSNFASCLLSLGKTEEAEFTCRKAIRLSPKFSAAWGNLGNILRSQGRWDEGIAAFHESISIDPKHAEAHSNLGNALREKSKLVEAEFHNRQATSLSPRLPGAWVNLGNTLLDRGEIEEAEKCFRQALSLGHEEARINLGKSLYDQGRPEESIECLSTLFKPHSAEDTETDREVRWNLSLPLLAQGNLEVGWEAYEWGRFLENKARWRGFSHFPEWDGTSLSGQSLLVYAEQGVGDEIMFASCLPTLLLQNVRCVIECDRRLASLFSRSFPAPTIIVGAERNSQDWLSTVGSIDLQIPIGSLPKFFRRSLSDFQIISNYLKPDPIRVSEWRSWVANLGVGLKVGISWRSGLQTGDRGRQYSRLEEWGPIFSIPRIHFVNLQYDECAEELAKAEVQHGVSIHVAPGLDLMNDLDGAAALSACLDLVISAGNAAGEIAAAVGVPVWRLEAHGRPWTTLGTNDFPWHPKMRVFRQVKPGEWTEVIDRIRNVLVEKNTTDLELLLDQGKQYQKDNDLDKAAECYETILLINPNSAEAHNNFGNVYLSRKDLVSAERSYRQALVLEPNYPEAWNNLGVLLGKQKHLSDAIDCYEKTLELNPALLEPRFNLANLLQSQGNPLVAEKNYKVILEKDPKNFMAWNGLALVLVDQFRWEEAQTCFEEAQKHAPENARINWNQGLAYLSQGDLERGWEGYEWGYHTAGRLNRGFGFTEWDGRYDPNATLLVHAEQGVGDEVLFSSCVPDLLSLVGRCVLECSPRLASLFARSFPRAEIHGVSRLDRDWLEKIGNIDFQCPMGSLGYYLRRNLSSFPQCPSYLLPDPVRRVEYKKRLENLPSGLRVGISWRSRLVHSDRGRVRFYSRLKQWDAIFRIPGAIFINLQYEDCVDELAEVKNRFGVEIVEFSDLDLFNDLDGVATLASLLDLVIAPPNAVAELSAAVGTEVWRLDAALPSWPMLGTDYLPWHPRTRVFRQDRLGEWEETLERVGKLLARRVEMARRERWMHYAPVLWQGKPMENFSLAKLAQPGATVVQIGAQDDLSVLAVARAIGEKGRLLVFEDRPEVYHRLRDQVLCRNLDQVECYPERISNRSSLQDHVICHTVDDIGLRRCDLLILDIEGREFEVLQGALRTLSSYYPLVSLGRYRHEASKGVVSILETHSYQALTHCLGTEFLLLAYPKTH